jgi:RNA polymerase sigma-70 factor, ECF subfamily
MRRLADGHDAALNELMDRHAEALFHFLVRALQNESDAEDLAQETFVRIHRNRSRFDLRQKFTTWMYAIASNLARDRYRWRSRHPQVSLDAPTSEGKAGLENTLPSTDSTPDQVLQADECAAAVSEAVAELPEELRQPLILAVYQGLSQAEIGAVLRCSAKAVETRIYRARKQLRAALAQWGK